MKFLKHLGLEYLLLEICRYWNNLILCIFLFPPMKRSNALSEFLADNSEIMTFKFCTSDMAMEKDAALCIPIFPHIT